MSRWQVAERGSVAGIQFVAWLQRTAGLRLAAAFVSLLAWYYTVFAAGARRASKAYLLRAGQPATLGNVHQHFFYFAQVALHRLVFLTGDLSPFTIDLHGHERLMGALAGGRGALLLGAHLGSFEAMRALATEYSVPLTVLVDFRNAVKINSVLKRLQTKGTANVRMLQIEETNASALFEAKDCIARGELVAVLADRVPAKGNRFTVAEFLGAEAHWPTGPYLLAHTLACPVFLVGAFFTPPGRYDIHCVPFAETVNLPRSDRAGALAKYTQRYADALAAWVAEYPYNWFNFYDFWSLRR